MPKYKIKAPNGVTYEVTTPEPATEQDLIAYVLQQNPEAGVKPRGHFLQEAGKGIALGVLNTPNAIQATLAQHAANAEAGMSDIDNGVRSREGLSASDAARLAIPGAGLLGVMGDKLGSYALQAAYSATPKKIRDRLHSTARGMVEDSVTNQQEFYDQHQDLLPRVGNLTDVRNGADFADWAGSTMGGALPAMAVTIGTAALTKNPAAVIGVSSAMQLPQNIQTRIDAKQNELKDLPKEERITRLSRYLSDTYGTTVWSAIASGALELAGPEADVIKNMAQEGIKQTTGAAIRQAARQIPREMLTEGATGAAQEAVNIAGEYAVGEQRGNPLNKANVLRILNSAAAEAAGGLVGGGINVTLEGVRQNIRNKTREIAERNIQDVADEAGLDVKPHEILQEVEKEYNSHLENGLDPADALKAMEEPVRPVRTGRDVAIDDNINRFMELGFSKEDAERAGTMAWESENPEVKPTEDKTASTQNPVQQGRIVEDLPPTNTAQTQQNVQNVAPQVQTPNSQTVVPNIQQEDAPPVNPTPQVTPTATEAIPMAPPVSAPPVIDAAPVTTPDILSTPTPPKTKAAKSAPVVDPAYAALPIEQRKTIAKLTIEDRVKSDPMFEGVKITPMQIVRATNQLAGLKVSDPTEALAKVLKINTPEVAQPTPKAPAPGVDVAKIQAISNDISAQIAKISTSGSRSLVRPTITAMEDSGIITPVERTKLVMDMKTGTSVPDIAQKLGAHLTAWAPTITPNITTPEEVAPTLESQEQPPAQEPVFEAPSPEIVPTDMQAPAGVAPNTLPQTQEEVPQAAIEEAPSELESEETIVSPLQITPEESIPYVAPNAIIKNVTQEQADVALGHAQRANGEIVYQHGDQGLIHTVNPETGTASYHVFKQNQLANRDISEIKKHKHLKPEEAALIDEMRAAKKAHEATRPTSEKPIKQKAVKKLKESKEIIDKGLHAIRISNTAHANVVVPKGFKDVILGHTLASFSDALKENYTFMRARDLKLVLPELPTTWIINWKGDKIPALARLQKLEEELRGAKNGYVKAFARIGTHIEDFIKKHGQTALSNAMHIGRYNEVPMSTWGSGITLQEAFNADDIYNQYTALVKDKKTTKSERGGYTKKLNARKRQIEAAHDMWVNLGKQPGGHAIYKQVHQYYRDMYYALRAELDAQIKALPVSEGVKNKLLADVRFEKERVKTKVKRDNVGGEDFSDAGVSIVPEEYFPFRRYGEYSVNITAPKAAPAYRKMFVSFETEAERDSFVETMAHELGVKPNDSAVFRLDNSAMANRRDFNGDSGYLKEVFKSIDAIEASDEGTVDEKTLDKLKDDIYQMYLMTLPERSIRKQFIHADKVTGFSADVLRNFSSSAAQYANQLSTMKYAPKIKNTIDEAYASLEGHPDPKEVAKLKTIIDVLGDRIQDSITAPKDTPFLTMANRLVFFQFLSGAASAVVQYLSIPTVVLPRLTRHYGYAGAVKHLSHYFNVFQTWGLHDENTGKTRLPSLEYSAELKNNPLKQAAFRAGVARDAFGSVHEELLRAAATEKPDGNGFATGTRKFGNLVAKVMAAGITTTERQSREIAYMAAFDLHFAKTKNFQASVDAAVKLSNDTLGRYSSFERPDFMHKGIGKSAFQFKQYAINITTLHLTNVATILSQNKNVSPAERKAALLETGHILMMGWMIHGLGRSAVYPVIVHTIAAISSLLSGDDDEEERLRRLTDPYFHDHPEFTFKYSFLPRVLGEPALYERGTEADQGQGIKLPGMDGRLHYLSDILNNGLVSELSGWDVGSRTSAQGLWFREPEGTVSTSGAQEIGNLLVNNIPFLSYGAKLYDGIKAFNNGDVMQGAELLAPALLAGPLKAFKLASQGSETSRQKDIVPAEDINDWALVGQALGFTPMQVSRIKKAQRESTLVQKRLEAQKTSLINNYFKALDDVDTNPGKVDHRIDQIIEFNDKHPSPALVITQDTLVNSYRSRQAQDALSIRGQQFSKKEAPYLAPYTYGPEQ